MLKKLQRSTALLPSSLVKAMDMFVSQPYRFLTAHWTVHVIHGRGQFQQYLDAALTLAVLRGWCLKIVPLILLTSSLFSVAKSIFTWISTHSQFATRDRPHMCRGDASCCHFIVPAFITPFAYTCRWDIFLLKRNWTRPNDQNTLTCTGSHAHASLVDAMPWYYYATIILSHRVILP